MEGKPNPKLKMIYEPVFKPLKNKGELFDASKPVVVEKRTYTGVVDKQGVNYFPEGPELGTAKRYRELRAQIRKEQKDSYEYKKVIDFPRSLIIEPTNYCNLSCDFCPIMVMKRPAGFMEMDVYKKIADECAENGLYGLTLYMLGEPMLHKNLREMIIYAKEKGIPAVNLSTNGNAKGMEEKILETNLDDIIFSLDGFTKETYEAMRRDGNFEKMMEYVNKFLDAKVKGGYKQPYVRIQIINSPMTAPEIPQFLDYWLNIPGVDCVYVHNLDGMVPWLGENIMNKEYTEKFNSNRKPCNQLWIVPAVFWNGDISACCHDAHGDLIIGNIKNTSIKQAWHSKKLNAYRNAHINGNYPEICKNCTEWGVW